MKAEFKALAYNWAIVVCRPEYKASVNFILCRFLKNIWIKLKELQ